MDVKGADSRGEMYPASKDREWGGEGISGRKHGNTNWMGVVVQSSLVLLQPSVK